MRGARDLLRLLRLVLMVAADLVRPVRPEFRLPQRWQALRQSR